MSAKLAPRPAHTAPDAVRILLPLVCNQRSTALGPVGPVGTGGGGVDELDPHSGSQAASNANAAAKQRINLGDTEEGNYHLAAWAVGKPCWADNLGRAIIGWMAGLVAHKMRGPGELYRLATTYGCRDDGD